MSRTYRVGTVNYLNARPLTWAIEHGEVARLEAVPAVPSTLDRQLVAGEIQAALVSSVVALREPDLAVMPAAGCIASDGPVQSVLLFTKCHLDQVDSVALDTSSVTSVALVRILLEQRHGRRPTYRPMAPDLPAMLAACDAALLIGDPGLSQYVRAAGADLAYDLVDLGREWREWTGLPFVFAAWVGPTSISASDLPALLRDGAALSRRAIPAIARVEAARLGLPERVCRHYLEQVIRYDLGDREMAGFRHFEACWRELSAR